MKILDCTLRDGGNVVGKGFDAEYTEMMVRGLLDNGIETIEMGNCTGIGSYEKSGSIAPCTDLEYLKVVEPYVSRGKIGMFMLAKNAEDKYIRMAAEHGLSFLRVGANAGDGKGSLEAIKKVKAVGLECKYSLMKAYVLSAKELAEEAKMLADCGLDEITIMDSAGTMFPDEVSEYVSEMVNTVSIPVGFHGHNNLGLSVGNALAAEKAGASVLDGGLIGMARSAGNCPTELLVAVLQRQGKMMDINMYGLLEFLDNELVPAMKKYDYRPTVTPNDLVYGYAGCHSSYSKMLEETAKKENVSLYKLIVGVSSVNRKNPDQELMTETAHLLK